MESAAISLQTLSNASGFLEKLEQFSATLFEQIDHDLNDLHLAITNTSKPLADSLNKITADLVAVTENSSKTHFEVTSRQRADDPSSLFYRLDLVVPAALFGMMVGLNLLDLSSLKSATWGVATLGPEVGGLSARAVLNGIRISTLRFWKMTDRDNSNC